MGGWGSNSKWALLGGMRSAAQVVSYEIPAGLAAMTAIIMAGSLSMQDLIKAQGGAPWEWAAFASPFTMAAFIIFFIAQLAEGNRTPFDLPEAESELVSGYNTEYSGMRFSLFFLAEYTNMVIVSMVAATIFLGGYRGPILPGPVWFFLKVYSMIFVMMWMRWTFPRLRFDQLMNLAWGLLIPLAILNLLITAIVLKVLA